jgi:hypothetical protein
MRLHCAVQQIGDEANRLHRPLQRWHALDVSGWSRIVAAGSSGRARAEEAAVPTGRALCVSSPRVACMLPAWRPMERCSGRRMSAPMYARAMMPPATSVRISPHVPLIRLVVSVQNRANVIRPDARDDRVDLDQENQVTPSQVESGRPREDSGGRSAQTGRRSTTDATREAIAHTREGSSLRFDPT